MDDFDRQIEDSFHGIGQPRSELAGAFLAAVTAACEGTKYQALTAWEAHGGVCVTLEYPDSDLTASGILFISQPDLTAVERQARDYLIAFIATVESPLYQKRGTEPLD